MSAELRWTAVSASGTHRSAVDTPMLLEEVTHGGSGLDVLGRVHAVDEVASALDRALDARRPEVCVPDADSIPSRLQRYLRARRG